jgi:hypothetical protein
MWGQTMLRNLPEENIKMGFLDSIVARSFLDQKAGRVVVFSGDRRNRGYLVKSEAEELKIKSFLKMFYFANLSILLLGMLTTNAWSGFLITSQAFDRPAAHLVRIGSIFLGIYSLVVGLPYFLLWRSYKKSISSFVSAQDEVLVSGKNPAGVSWIAIALFALALIILAVAIFFVVRAK